MDFALKMNDSRAWWYFWGTENFLSVAKKKNWHFCVLNLSTNQEKKKKKKKKTDQKTSATQRVWWRVMRYQLSYLYSAIWGRCAASAVSSFIQLRAAHPLPRSYFHSLCVLLTANAADIASGCPWEGESCDPLSIRDWGFLCLNVAYKSSDYICFRLAKAEFGQTVT